MGIDFDNGTRIDRRKIEEAMSLIRTWVKPEEISYDEDLDCLKFVTIGRNGERNYLYMFDIEHIGIEPELEPKLLAVHTSRGSTIYIHSSGMISVMTH